MGETFLFFTDPHFRHSKAKMRIDDTYKTQFEKLDEIKSIVKERKVKEIWCGGDFFNENPSHELVGDLIQWCRDVEVPIKLVLGNHDVTGYNLDSASNRAIGVLEKAGAIEILSDEIVYFSLNFILKGIPTSLGFNQKYTFNSSIEELRKIIISHNYVIPSEKMPWDFIHPRDIKTNADLVLCGHYHTPFKYINGKTTWINPGALCRWKITEMNRKPNVLLIHVGDTIEVEPIELKSAKPGKDVFNLDELSLEEKRSLDIESFIQSLNNTEFSSVDIEDVIRTVGKKNHIDKEILDESINRVQMAKRILQ